MSRDSSHTHLHLHSPHHADLLEDFTSPRSALSPEEVYVPPHHQPINPEDEDDVVPDQHAAFGIVRAMKGPERVSWRDLGLEELLRRGPGVAGAGGSAQVVLAGLGTKGPRRLPR